MKIKVKMDDLMPVFREQLDVNGKVAFSPSGISMRPMLEHGIDEVYLEKIDGKKVKKWDVVLFQSDNGAYILHRIVKIRKDGFITRGDNNYYNDDFQNFDKIIGRVYQFVHKGKMKSVNCLSYRIYVIAWILSYLPRKVIRKLKRL